jgi:hypothetical protein
MRSHSYSYLTTLAHVKLFVMRVVRGKKVRKEESVKRPGHLKISPDLEEGPISGLIYFQPPTHLIALNLSKPQSKEVLLRRSEVHIREDRQIYTRLRSIFKTSSKRNPPVVVFVKA